MTLRLGCGARDAADAAADARTQRRVSHARAPLTSRTMFASTTTSPAAIGASARYAPRCALGRRNGARAASRARAIAVVRAGGGASDDDEVALLEKALKLAKARKTESAKATPAAVVGAGGGYSGASFNVKTFNAISPVGLNKFPAGKYAVSGDDAALPGPPMAIMLRSHKLQASEVPPTVRGIVRCGAGTNNIPVKEMSDMGIPVFNTPGANANAVKELVVCSLLLASRGIIEGNRHVNEVINVEEGFEYAKIDKRIEKDKAMFGGREIEGKTLGVIGLGAIGSRYVHVCECVWFAFALDILSRAFFAVKGMTILN